MTHMSWSLSHCVFCGLPLSSPQIWGKPFNFLKSQFSCLQSRDSPEHLGNLNFLYLDPLPFLGEPVFWGGVFFFFKSLVSL